EARADEGRVAVFGRDLARLRPRSIALLRRQLGIVPQDLRLIPDRSALHNVALALELQRAPRRHARARAADVLADVGFPAGLRTRAGRLSPGEQQLVAIARALVREPPLLIMDQPTAHLDGAATSALVALLAGRTALVASNDGELLAAAAYRGWRIVELRDGMLRTVDATPAAVEVAGMIDTGGDVPLEIANVVPFPVSARAGGTE
ncbi:MAG TPA: ATP-binding cassette domain-containing protein, partial [Kofleriaceae bacterium]|nr:ATP-binding cassette domain-containing protein [Kofleriaceae bacterium]